MDNFLRCPVCGKAPKIKRTLFGTSVVQCKPLIGAAHVKTTIKPTSPFTQKKVARKAWNEAVYNSIRVKLNERKVV